MANKREEELMKMKELVREDPSSTDVVDENIKGQEDLYQQILDMQ